MKWFKTHLEGTLWIVWLGGGALLAGLIVAIKELETVETGLSLMGWWLIILFSIGYIATLIKVCNWVLEEKAQDRSIMWAFLIVGIGGIFPITVALFGRNNTVVKVTDKAESADHFEIRRLIEREKGQPLLNSTRSSERALKLAKEHFNRALEYEGMGERNQAIEEYTKTLEFNNRHAMAYYNRGLLLMRTGKKTRARTDFQKVISLSEGTDLADMAKRSMQEMDAYNPSE